MKLHSLKRCLALLLALAMMLSIVVIPAGAEEGDGVTIKLHYHRPDGNYTDWSVWFWNFGQEGTDIPFAEENGEMVATFPVASGVTSVGFIVKLPNWAAKDVNEDQFIDVAAYLSGTVHVYVESGVKGYEIVLGDDVVSGIKVKSAVYKEDQGFQIAMTGPVDPQNLTVIGPEGPVNIVSFSDEGNNLYTLVPENAADLYFDYTVIFAGETYPVTMPNIYSTAAFESEYTYHGSDLGATWTPENTAFRVWAPTATAVTVNLYASGDPAADDLMEQIEMTPDVNGTWIAVKEGDLNGTYYTYEVTVDGNVVEACDPYARTTGVNGKRAMVIDLDSTDPVGWDEDTDPHYGNAITDAVIYELHVRDLSVDANSGITNKGKFLGLIETGTTTPDGIPTGLDHIKSLGITHIHLLPSYDYGSVDESRLDTPQFNWGYDPVNYNVPEGSYSTDPFHGEVRVREFKEMVKGLHDNGISVVMDVVYNHVYSGGDFCFNKIVPQYFSRVSDSGVYSNGSGCGNDTASERAMVRKYIVDSVLYWVEEYHIDGFRFDLVGLIDTETINAVMEEVHKEHPNVIFYGEGWTMSTNMTKQGYTLTTQVNSAATPEFAFFSDTIRDALKGNVFNNTEPGYVSSQGVHSGTIASCFKAMSSWSKNPSQTVNYASCHDNMTLFDRITNSTPEATVADRIRMNNLAAAIYMTSQGIPFIHAGEEMLRSKPLADGTFDHNSYSSSDEVNNLKWADLSKEEYQQVFAYYQGLIAFRQAHPALRLTNAEDVAAYVSTMEGVTAPIVGHVIAAGAGGEAQDIAVLFNPKNEAVAVTLPEGEWTVYINGEQAGTEALAVVGGEISLAPISALVLVKTGDTAPEATEATDAPSEDVSVGIIGGADGPTAIFVTGGSGVVIGIVAAVIAAAAAIFWVFRKRRK